MTLLTGSLAIASAALFAGGALYVSVVEHPARMQAGVTVAMAQFSPSYRRAAPWQGTLAAICALTAGLTAVLTSRWSWAVGGGLVGMVIPFTLVVIMPTNRRLLADRRPNEDEAVALLKRWARLHWIRSVLGTGGLLVLLAAAARV